MLKLKAERIRKGWTQLDLACHARVQPAEISRFERGQAKPYQGQATRLAEVLGLAKDELLEQVALEPQPGV